MILIFKRPQLPYKMLTGWCCLQFLLDQLHNNNTKFGGWVGGGHHVEVEMEQIKNKHLCITPTQEGEVVNCRSQIWAVLVVESTTFKIEKLQILHLKLAQIVGYFDFCLKSCRLFHKTTILVFRHKNIIHNLHILAISDLQPKKK